MHGAGEVIYEAYFLRIEKEISHP